MWIYFVYYFGIMALGVLLKVLGVLNTKKGKSFFISAVWIILTLLCGLRSFNVAYDGEAYNQIFQYISKSRWVSPTKYTYYIEYGFYALCKLISLCGGTTRTMYLITSAFIAFAACRFIYLNADDILLAVLLILSFPYFYTSFDLIRYYVAYSVILLATPFIKSRKLVPFLLCVVFAAQFHKSCALFIVLYFLPLIRWNGKTIAAAFAAAAFAMFFSRSIAVLLSKIFNDYTSYISGINTRWVGNFAGGIKTAIMYVIILCLAVVAYQNKVECRDKYNQNLGFVVLTALTSIVFINSSIAIRLLVAMLPYMSIGMTSLVSENDCAVESTNFLARYAVILISISYHTFLILNNWMNIVPYQAL